MTWVRRAEATEPQHVCEPPTRERVWCPPSASLAPNAETGAGIVDIVPDGKYGDLWRCDWTPDSPPNPPDTDGIWMQTASIRDTGPAPCGRLWRIGSSCDYGPHAGRCPRGGYHPDGLKWRPATLWQRLRYRRTA